VFSGQTLYEKYLYQLYNIAFTGLPIFWFSLFDQQFLRRKEDEEDPKALENIDDELYFMEHPLLFIKGMRGEYFTKCEFLGWLLYAIFHAFLIFAMTFLMFGATNVGPFQTREYTNSSG
jgi:magnesium-transporting ATPase (P-type)